MHGIHTSNFIDELMDSPAFHKKLVTLSDQLNIPLREVMDEARDNFHEIAAEENPAAVETWDRICGWLARSYQLDVDDDQIEKIKQLNETATLVFLPNHRSYLDPMILRSALEPHGFPPNNVMGGANLSFWPLGSIMRRNNTVFIRREFKSQYIYKACLKEYIASLVRQKKNLEWYIEGGRTRTGKLRPPRMGMLSYVVEAFDPDGDEDILLVPVFVGYDQQYEVDKISQEEQGGVKAPESISWLIQFASAQGARRGGAHVRFGDPVSLKASLQQTRETDGPERAARMAVPKVAFEVMHRINQITPIMPSALITFALLDNEDHALTIPEGRRILAPLLDYLKQKNVDISDEIDLGSHGQLEKAIITLNKQGIIQYFDGGPEVVYWITDNRQHEAAFYRNTMIHHLVNRAIIEIGLIAAAEENAKHPIDAIWAEAVELRDLLKYEFFFPRTRDWAGEIMYESDLAYPGWADQEFGSDELVDNLRATKLCLAHRVIGPFLEAYGVVAEQLAKAPVKEEIDTKEFILECIGVAQQRWYQGKLHSPESISKDLFTNALTLADNRGLLKPGTRGLKAKRQAFAKEFKEAVRRTDVIRELARLREES